MKINLAKTAGFCFGVKRAIDIALKTAGSNNNVCMLGDIVHNEEVVKLIKESGVKKIKKLAQGENKILLIRAHGVDIKTFEKTGKSGYKVIDATCPMVKEIHKIVRGMEKQGYGIIVIGDKKHDEVKGIIGQLKTKALVIDNINNIPLSAIKRMKKACVVVQSTQNIEKVTKIIGILKQRINNLEFFNTICRPTRMKQEEIKKMPKENDVMIIIGSKNSANTKRLYEISRALNEKSYWINSKKEIKPGWFKSAQSVGVTAGASTPESTIQDVIKQIKKHSY